MSAKKNDQEKVDLSLIPRPFLDEVARAFMVGQKKYGRYNYKGGMEVTRLLSASLRHITAYNEGEEFDPEDGQHHLGAAGACIAMILSQKQHGTLIDNRYTQHKKIMEVAKEITKIQAPVLQKLAQGEQEEFIPVTEEVRKKAEADAKRNQELSKSLDDDWGPASWG